MAGLSEARHQRIKSVVAVALSFVAGFVDLVGYLSLGLTFTAHMTGNTVHLGEGLMQAKWLAVGKGASLIATFVTGSIFARGLIEAASRIRLRSIAVVTLILEAGLLGIVILCANYQWLSLVILAAAMGVQTAILTRVGSLTVHTTFVTGMLNKLAQLLSHALFLTYDLLRGSSATRDARHVVLAQSRFIFAVWFFYVAGAAAGTIARSRWGVSALFLPLAIIALLSLVDLIAPLAIEEERDASER